MELLVDGYFLYRYKKKWSKRYCKLVRTNTFSDSVSLLVYGSDNSNHRSRNQRAKSHSYSLHQSMNNTMSNGINRFIIYGHMHGIHMSNQTHVMFLVSKTTVEALAFEDFYTMKLWSDCINKHLSDISQFADLIEAHKHSQLKCKLEGRLVINCSHISFIRGPGNFEPKLFMSWKIADILEYGVSKDIIKKSGSGNINKSNVFSHPTSPDDVKLPQQKLFVINVTPLHPYAPGIHKFSCTEPQKIATWLNQLSNNQENVGSNIVLRREVHIPRQRHDSCRYSSTTSPSALSISSSNSPAESSPPRDTNVFFPADKPRSRLPRFCRSVSESRPYQGLEMNESNVMRLCESNRTRDNHENNNSYNEEGDDIENAIETTDNDLSSTSTIRSSHNVTWLEKYPYERDVTNLSPVPLPPPLSSSLSSYTNPYRRQMSEDLSQYSSQRHNLHNQHEQHQLQNYQSIYSTFTPTRKRSTGHHYCSISSFRTASDELSSGLDISTNSTLQSNTNSNTNNNNMSNSNYNTIESLYIDRARGLSSRRYMSLSEHFSLMPSSLPASSIQKSHPHNSTTPTIPQPLSSANKNTVNSTPLAIQPTTPSPTSMVTTNNCNYANLEFHQLIGQIEKYCDLSIEDINKSDNSNPDSQLQQIT